MTLEAAALVLALSAPPAAAAAAPPHAGQGLRESLQEYRRLRTPPQPHPLSAAERAELRRQIGELARPPAAGRKEKEGKL